MKRPSRRLLAAALFVAACAALPVVYLLIRALGAGPEQWRIFTRPRVWEVFGNSALLAAVTTSASIAIGVPLAWLTSRTDLPGRRFWTVASVLPLTMPSYIASYTFIEFLGPRRMVAGWLAPLGVERLPEIRGLAGAALVITLINYPFVVLSVRAALSRLDPAIEEAARGLGHTPRQAFWRITLPHLRPGIIAGALLVALYTLSDFGTPEVMGYNSFTRVIYRYYRGAFNRDSAALTALLLVALTLAILAGVSFAQGRARYYRSTSGSPRPAPIARLGRWKWPAFGFCALVASASLGVPILILVHWMLEAAANNQPLGFDWRLAVSSFSTALVAGLVATLAAVPVVYLAVRHRGILVGVADRAAYLGNALPGIVVALGLVFFGARVLPGWLYPGMPILIFAYAVRFLPQAVGCVRSSMLQAPPRLEEAARGLGLSPGATFLRVTAPLLAPGFAAGVALVFLTTIKELPLTLLVGPPGFENLVTEVWANAAEGLFGRAAAPALLLVLISALSVGVILAQERRSERA